MPLPTQYRTAILIFANTSGEELRCKKIANGTLLFDALTTETLQMAKKSGLHYFHFTEQEQSGNTFGERFANAIRAVFNLGFESIITIGNDTPQLKESHLLEASSQLNLGNFVLGPSFDGGFYLMGLHKAHFNYTAFLRLPWQTARLTNQLSHLLHLDKAQYVRLEPLEDIDTIEDIKALLKLMPRLGKNLISLLLSFIKRLNGIVTMPLLPLDYYLLSFQFNKGSPN